LIAVKATDNDKVLSGNRAAVIASSLVEVRQFGPSLFLHAEGVAHLDLESTGSASRNEDIALLVLCKSKVFQWLRVRESRFDTNIDYPCLQQDLF